MSTRFFIFFFFCSVSLMMAQGQTVQSQTTAKTNKQQLRAVFVEKAPKIDGLLQEEEWSMAPFVSDFIENFPEPNTPSSMRTEVRVLYNTEAIYIAAKMFDTAPDSILRQLCVRDDIRSANADYFTVFLDAMFTQQNSFSFTVTAAGVQGDASDGDNVWDAVWRSEVKVVEDGWQVEIEIPYSQLRFPKSLIQTWGINFSRTIRRYRETSYWAKIAPEIDGEVQQYGVLTGIERIKPPVRLSFTPYAAAYLRVQDDGNASTPNVRPAANAGTDLKYGINESFTLDVALIPDFGDVQYDNQELNISPFEIYYAERRPFFTEGTQLFNRAGIFYSRRVGNAPTRYHLAYNQLDSTETVIRNPDRTQLINALKLSGRNSKGMGFGLFNAVTGPAHARIVDNVSNDQRRYLTEPLTNYNILVLDQQFRNNSFVSLISSSTLRLGSFTDALVTGTEFRFTDKKNQYAVSGNGAYSHRFLDSEMSSDEFQNGYKAYLSGDKVSGKVRYGLSQSVMSKNYNINDLGYVVRTNFVNTAAYVGYNIFSPFGIYNNMRMNLSAYYERLYTPSHFMRLEISGNIWGTTRKFMTSGLDFSYQPFGFDDYFEARLSDQVWKKPVWGRIGGFFSSDYRKTFALDGRFSYRRFHNETPEWKNADVLEGQISPRIRFSDRLNMVLWQNTTIRHNNIGFVARSYDATGSFATIFGARYYQTLENRITVNYLFNNRFSLSFSARHYWALVKYNKFYELLKDGTLGATSYSKMHDQNYNAFNVDLIFRWRFAPGSELNVVWKNAVLNYGSNLEFNYFNNFAQMFEENQLNQFSVKFLYFLDVYKLQPASKRGQRLEE